MFHPKSRFFLPGVGAIRRCVLQIRHHTWRGFASGAQGGGKWGAGHAAAKRVLVRQPFFFQKKNIEELYILFFLKIMWSGTLILIVALVCWAQTERGSPH